MNKNIRIAVQSKGRLSEDSLKFLASLGLIFAQKERSFVATCSNAPVDLVFLRDDDIPQYVEKGVTDFGIVGENVLLEKSTNSRIVKKLGFSSCSLVLAVPIKSKIRSVLDLEGERIATTYPNLLKAFLLEQNIEAAIIKLKGSVEIAPALNLADAICDLTQSGRTLRENNLKIIATIMESQAVFIRSPFLSAVAEKNVDSLFLQSTFS
jgi:ATP phosphoribosyltransferase